MFCVINRGYKKPRLELGTPDLFEALRKGEELRKQGFPVLVLSMTEEEIQWAIDNNQIHFE